MLSLRNLNLVMVIDPPPRRCAGCRPGHGSVSTIPSFCRTAGSWYSTTAATRAADRFSAAAAFSRYPGTRRVETLYEGSQEAPFFSNVKGKQQLLANGDLLITEAEQGRVFEVAPDGRIVWSHISRFDDDHVSKISDAERYSETLLPPQFKNAEFREADASRL